MPHTSEGQALIDRRAEEARQRWNGERPLFDTALTKGDFRLAEPGAECWAHTEGDLADIRMRGDSEARGGIILEITSDPDPATGDLRRAFRCFDYTAPLWQSVTVLQESMIDPDSFSAPDWARIRRQYRLICYEIGKKVGGRRRSNPIASQSELDLHHVSWQLSSILRRVLP